MSLYKKSNITFVFAVESGIFEPQTIMAIESLRKFGGEYSNSPVLAITPRFGPRLTKDTLQAFESLNVNYIYRNENNKSAWFPYTNKALACKLADEFYADTAKKR